MVTTIGCTPVYLSCPVLRQNNFKLYYYVKWNHFPFFKFLKFLIFYKIPDKNYTIESVFDSKQTKTKKFIQVILRS